MKPIFWILWIAALLCTGCAGGTGAPASDAPGGADESGSVICQSAVLTVRRDAQTVLTYAVTAPEQVQAVSDIVLDSMVKSAAWEGVEVSELEAYVALCVYSAADSAQRCFYQYDADGRHVLQAGKAGYYTIMSDEAYEKLLWLIDCASTSEP